MPVPIVHVNCKPREIKQFNRIQNNKLNSQDSIIEHDSTIFSNKTIEHANDTEPQSENLLKDGSCQKIHRDRSRYIKKPDEHEFKKMDDISEAEYQKLKTLTKILPDKIHNRLKELGRQ